MFAKPAVKIPEVNVEDQKVNELKNEALKISE
jgi:hypothetical protein